MKKIGLVFALLLFVICFINSQEETSFSKVLPKYIGKEVIIYLKNTEKASVIGTLKEVNNEFVVIEINEETYDYGFINYFNKYYDALIYASIKDISGFYVYLTLKKDKLGRKR